MKTVNWAMLLLAGVTACASAQEPGPGEGGARRRMAPMPMDPEGMIMRALHPDSKLAKDIGMTEEQSTALKTLFTNSQTEMKESREKMEKLALQQADLLSQDAPDEAAVIKVVEQLGELRLQFAKHRIHQLLAAQKILTPEQRMKMREQMKARMEQLREGRKDGQGMREGGPGMRKGGARRGQDEGNTPPPPPPPAPTKAE